jgi:hypothetical protein
MEIITKQLLVYSIQSNMVAATVVKTKVNVLLSSGKMMDILCEKQEEAEQVWNILCYYSPGLDRNNAFDLKFDVKIRIS